MRGGEGDAVVGVFSFCGFVVVAIGEEEGAVGELEGVGVV